MTADEKRIRLMFRFRDWCSVYRASALACAFVIVALCGMMLFKTGEKRASASATYQSSSQWQMNEGAAITPSKVTSRISPADRSAITVVQSKGKAGAANNRIATAQQGDAEYVVLNVEFVNVESRKRFRVRGAHTFNSYDRFADLFVPVGLQTGQVLKAISEAQGVKRAEPAAKVIAPPPPGGEPPKQRGRQPAETIVRGGISGLTGKGVSIAIIDSGLDFRNPDFITYDAAGQPTSRLLYLWDTSSNDYDAKKLGSKPPLSYPNGASVGTLYTREQLTADLRSTTPSIPATDLVGHGTACAGIAAGNGNNGPGKDYVKGVAPEADIIAISVRGGTRASAIGSGNLNNVYLLGAICGWLDSVAGAKPLVVSCSFGGHYGGHDGARVIERQLDARFPLDARGRALLVSAGNDGQDPIHAAAEFKTRGERGLITWNSEKSVTIDVFFDNPDLKDIRIVPAVKKYATPSAKESRLVLLGGEVNPLTGQGAVYFGASAGEGGLFLFNLSGRPMKADAYISGGNFGQGASYQRQVSIPGTTKNAITVGSYDWSDEFNYKGQVISLPAFFCGSQDPLTIGGLSCYSNPGYSRNGTIKPDIVAPGGLYHASYAKFPDGRGITNEEQPPVVDTSGNYMLFNGTSAAAPYAAGVVALLMQKNPNLTLGEIKSLLQQHATQDNLTGHVPNIKWGYGKLDLAAVQKMIEAMK